MNGNSNPVRIVGGECCPKKSCAVSAVLSVDRLAHVARQEMKWDINKLLNLIHQRFHRHGLSHNRPEESAVDLYAERELRWTALPGVLAFVVVIHVLGGIGNNM